MQLRYMLGHYYVFLWSINVLRKRQYVNSKVTYEAKATRVLNERKVMLPLLNEVVVNIRMLPIYFPLTFHLRHANSLGDACIRVGLGTRMTVGVRIKEHRSSSPSKDTLTISEISPKCIQYKTLPRECHD